MAKVLEIRPDDIPPEPQAGPQGVGWTRGRPTKILKAQVEQRRKAVAANIASGLKPSEIAAAMNLSVRMVEADVRHIFDRWKNEQVAKIDRVKTLQHHRLMRALNAIWGKVTAGDMSAVDRFLKITEMEAKLLGTFAPQKIAPTNPEGDKPYEPLDHSDRIARIEALVEMARARALNQAAHPPRIEVRPLRNGLRELLPEEQMSDAELVPIEVTSV